jgi:hypothetical protein
MSPTPVNFNLLQPFKVVRDNWDTLKPYHDNYTTTISLATVLVAFMGTLSMVIKHGFKFPRLHPMMIEPEELKPRLIHENEFISEKDLVEVRLYEIENDLRWRVAEDERRYQEIREHQAAQAEKAPEDKVGEGEGVQNGGDDEIDPMTDAAEKQFQDTVEVGVNDAMEVLDHQGAFEVTEEETE